MKEHPILFSTEMVQALLQGRKSQTRRVIKHQPFDNTEIDGNFFEGRHKGYVKVDGHPDWQRQFAYHFCNYSIGDLLWVRETWVGHNRSKFKDYLSFQSGGYWFAYKADGKEKFPNGEVIKWKPSIFMPKTAARIWLEVTDIRVERLQDINEEDAKAEGAEKVWQDEKGNFWFPASESIRTVGEHGDFKTGFNSIWHGINGEESWNQNPWVWVISFKVLSTTGKQNIQNDIPKTLTKELQS